MSGPRIGELFAGYGGLGMGVKAVLGGEVAWVSDIDKGARKVLAHRFPDVPNLGDITTVDWSQVEPVDVLTGGFPCQDVSAAGKRAGIRPGTRSGLWTHFAYAIDQLRPRLVVIENVRGLLSAEAHSDMEPCAWCVGDEPDGVMRALGAVLGDLAGLGFDAEWIGLRAADVGAPHGRFRVFIVAYPTGDTGWVLDGDGVSAGDTERVRRIGGAQEPQRLAFRRVAAAGSGGGALLPSPRTSDTNGAGAHGDGGLDLRTAVSLLPTPRAASQRTSRQAMTAEHWSAPSLEQALELLSGDLPREYQSWEEVPTSLLPTPMSRDWKGSGPADDNRHDPNLSAIPRLLPTPRAFEGGGNGPVEAERHSPGLQAVDYHLQNWGQYADAIARWEALTRPAPAPTETGPKGNPRLSPAFSEWLMGLPAGWITDVPGVTRNEALKLAGNGVVPQQAEAALRFLLGVMAVAA